MVSPKTRADKRIVDFFMRAPLFCDIISEVVQDADFLNESCFFFGF